MRQLAWSSRSRSSPPTIASVLKKRQSALQKSRIDRATAWPTGEGWSCALGLGCTVCVGRPSGVLQPGLVARAGGGAMVVVGGGELCWAWGG